MEFKGTKGNWKVGYLDKDNNINGIVVWSPDYSKMPNGQWEMVCHISEIDNILEHDKANAKLISCAPEMLEMLEKIVDAQFNSEKSLANLNSEIAKAKQLIKKATEI